MELKTARIRYIRSLTMLASASLIAVAVVFRLLMPDKPLLPFVSIPVFFYLAGLLYIYVITFCRENFSSDKQVNCFLACKAMKFLLSAVYVLVYAMAVKAEVKSFLLTFIVFFVVFLIFETRFFLLFEAQLKHKTN